MSDSHQFELSAEEVEEVSEQIMALGEKKGYSPIQTYMLLTFVLTHMKEMLGVEDVEVSILSSEDMN